MEQNLEVILNEKSVELSHQVVMVLSAQSPQKKNQQNSVRDVVQLSRIQIIAISQAIQQAYHNN